MSEELAHRGLRLTSQRKNIHTAAMTLLLLIGMPAAEARVIKADDAIVVKN
ncbi:MAG: hypothetical protein ABSD64_06520 [Terriglobales bacterium]|jgi:hypothetical protein